MQRGRTWCTTAALAGAPPPELSRLPRPPAPPACAGPRAGPRQPPPPPTALPARPRLQTQHQVARRVLADQRLLAGGYLRVHVHPKRFPAAYQVDWGSRVVAVAPEFVVVNKPPGVQVGADRGRAGACACGAARCWRSLDSDGSARRRWRWVRGGWRAAWQAGWLVRGQGRGGCTSVACSRWASKWLLPGAGVGCWARRCGPQAAGFWSRGSRACALAAGPGCTAGRCSLRPAKQCRAAPLAFAPASSPSRRPAAAACCPAGWADSRQRAGECAALHRAGWAPGSRPCTALGCGVAVAGAVPLPGLVRSCCPGPCLPSCSHPLPQAVSRTLLLPFKARDAAAL
jgi:hypothetical protein